MAIRSRFFSGTYYGQDDFKKMIKDGLTSGYVKGVGDGLKVTADGKSMVIQVGIGRGYLVGYSFDVMDDPYDLTVKGNTETEVRYDRVIAHMDEESGITVVVKQGDSKNPPELVREGKIYEISLAKIKVGKNVGIITQDNITDERGNKSVCGIVGPHYDSLPIATKDKIGAVKIGDNLNITPDGVLSADYAPFPLLARLYNSDTGYSKYIQGNVYSGTMGSEPMGIKIQNPETDEIHTEQFSWHTEFRTTSYHYHEIVSINAVDVITLKTRELYHSDEYCEMSHHGSTTVTPHLNEVCTISITGDNCYVVEAKCTSDTDVWLGVPTQESNNGDI